MSYARVQLGNDSDVDAETVNRIQTNIKRAVDEVGKVDPLIKVTFAVANVDTHLAHNLGRALVGYRIVRASAAVNIYDGSPSSDPTTFINVKASVGGGVAVTFEVF